MSPKFRRILAFVMAMMAGSVMAGAIKSWSSGETLGSADLDANFYHIHQNMVGGHGGRLVNADVNASAAIASSKLAGGVGIAKSFVYIADACTANPCTMINPYNVAGVAWNSTGSMTVTLPYTVTGSAVLVTPVDATSPGVYCTAYYLAGSTVSVICRLPGGALTDAGFVLVAFNTT